MAKTAGYSQGVGVNQIFKFDLTPIFLKKVGVFMLYICDTIRIKGIKSFVKK